MYQPITDKEFAVLHKLSGNVRKRVAKIGRCTPTMGAIEEIELKELINDVSSLLDYTLNLYNKK